jgi:hypothetical protein
VPEKWGKAEWHNENLQFHSCRGGRFFVSVTGSVISPCKTYKSSAIFLKQRNEPRTESSTFSLLWGVLRSLFLRLKHFKVSKLLFLQKATLTLRKVRLTCCKSRQPPDLHLRARLLSLKDTFKQARWWDIERSTTFRGAVRSKIFTEGVLCIPFMGLAIRF